MIRSRRALFRLFALLLAASTLASAGDTVAAQAAPSTQFTVSGGVEREITFSLAALWALPAQTVATETRSRAGSQGFAEYRGALLKDVLMLAQPRTDPVAKNDLLSRSVVVTGSDGYRATFAWGEFDPDFGVQAILVAYEMNGAPLADRDGAFEIVVPWDKLAGRWVKGIVRITVNEPPL